MHHSRRAVLARGLAVASLAAPRLAHAESQAKLTLDGRRVLSRLYATVPRSRMFGRGAKAILVFPRIYKAGFVFGAQTGDGVLFEHGAPAAYYNISAASFGLQAGGQAFSYVLFFMNDGALRYLRKSDGWALGTGPSIVLVKTGESADVSTTTVAQDVYAFPFHEEGLMAGVDIKGSKITRIHPR
jgi:lipid-binding SYLF domain-containing protein